MKKLIFLLVPFFMMACSAPKGELTVFTMVMPNGVFFNSDHRTEVFLFKLNGETLTGTQVQWAGGSVNSDNAQGHRWADVSKVLTGSRVDFENLEYGNYLLVIGTNAFLYPTAHFFEITIDSPVASRRFEISVPNELLDDAARDEFRDAEITKILKK